MFNYKHENAILLISHGTFLSSIPLLVRKYLCLFKLSEKVFNYVGKGRFLICLSYRIVLCTQYCKPSIMRNYHEFRNSSKKDCYGSYIYIIELL